MFQSFLFIVIHGQAMFGALIQRGFSVILKITVGNLYNISVTS